MVTVEPLTRVSRTEEMRKVLGGAIALSPSAPWIAETGYRDGDVTILRITNYESELVVAEFPIVCIPHSMRWSPSGTRLLVLPGGRGRWNRVLIFEAPWDGTSLVGQTSLDGVFDARWIDDDEYFIAGTYGYEMPCVARGRCSTSTLHVVEELPRIPNLQDGACGTDLIAFAGAWGATISLFRITSRGLDRLRSLAGEYDGNSVRIVINESDTTVVLVTSRRVYAYRLDGSRAWEITSALAFDSLVLRFGLLCGRMLDRRTRSESLTITRVQAGRAYRSLVDRPLDAIGKGCDVVSRDGIAYVAVEQSDHTDIYKLTDLDVIALGQASLYEREDAVRRLGERRYSPAVAPLLRCVQSDSDIAGPALRALVQIGDRAAISRLLHMIGDDALAPGHASIAAAVVQFPVSDVLVAVDAAVEGQTTGRRGVARLIARNPALSLVDPLLRLLRDFDLQTRREAAHALATRRDPIGRLALLAALADEDDEVRTAASRGLLDPTGSSETPLDLRGISEHLLDSVSAGAASSEHVEGERHVRSIITALLGAIELPAMLQGLDRLASAIGVRGGVAIHWLAADIQRQRGELADAAVLYRRAAELAAAKLPRHEWTAQLRRAECLMRLGRHRAAWPVLARAMEIVETLWFRLVVDDSSSYFFADKWRLFDAAVLCCQELGYHAEALESSERGRARWLGDLIARHHLAPERKLERHTNELWRELDRARRMYADVVTGTPPRRSEVVGVDAHVGAGASGVTPENLLALQQVLETTGDTRHVVAMVTGLWSLAALAKTEDELRAQFEALHRSLTATLAALEGMPGNASVELLITDYDTAFRPLWTRYRDRLPEHGFVYVRAALCDAPSEEWRFVFLAMREALDVVLHHETVYAVPSQGASPSGVGFVIRSLDDDATTTGAVGTIAFESRLARFEETRWRHVLDVARGRTAAFREIAADMTSSDQAHVELCVTERGTIAWVIHRVGDAERIEVFTSADVTLDAVDQRLVRDSDSWGRTYREIPRTGRSPWFAAMTTTLAWFAAEVWRPIEDYLRNAGITRLRIVPHRALHLLPFAAVPGRDGSPLIDSFEIRIAPSASLLAICAEREAVAPEFPFTAIANPTCNLPFANDEVDVIAKQYEKRRVLVGLDVHFETFTCGAWHHHAGHASYDWNAPLDSAFLLSGGGRMTLGELFDGRLDARGTNIAVLSACETAITDPENRADDCIGLASGLLFAGAKAVVATQWSVDDQSTRMLMERFHTEARTKDAPSALRAAQRWLRTLPSAEVQAAKVRDLQAEAPEPATAIQGPNGEPYWHSYYWAGFSVWTR